MIYKIKQLLFLMRVGVQGETSTVFQWHGQPQVFKKPLQVFLSTDNQRIVRHPGGRPARHSYLQVPKKKKRGTRGDVPGWQPTGGALGAVRTRFNRSATIWACGRTSDPYFVILGGRHFCLRAGFDTSSTLGIWYFWIFIQFHTFPAFFTLFLLIFTTSTLFYRGGGVRKGPI